MNWRRLLYSVAYALATPIFVARLIWRGHKHRLSERFGLFAPPDHNTPIIWVHSVSVGETIAAAPLIRALQRRHPDFALCVTTTTATGSERVKALFGNAVFHVYNPFDVSLFIDNFLHRVQPKLCIVMETELWPNMLYRCHQAGVPVLIANARLSEKSARGYGRFANFSRMMLGWISHIAVQNDTDGQRFLRLGLAPTKLTTTGSIKFDIRLSEEQLQTSKKLRQHLNEDGLRPIWIAASTHRGEDEIILEAHHRLLKDCPNARLILVPRHPERFDHVFTMTEQEGFAVCRRSEKEVNFNWQVMIGDTMGELVTLLGCADIAFIGGSLVPNGGHNMLEAAIWACPVLTGPHLFNFQDISNMMLEGDAMKVINNSQQLSTQLTTWLQDPSARSLVGDNGLKVVLANRGALDRLIDIADALLQ